jgi:hypothetical protein
MHEEQIVPLPLQLLTLGLTVVLTLLAAGAALMIWRQTAETLALALISDVYVARLVDLVLQIALGFFVVLIMLIAEPWLRRAKRHGQMRTLFFKLAGGIIAFGVAGWLIELILARA